MSDSKPRGAAKLFDDDTAAPEPSARPASASTVRPAALAGQQQEPDTLRAPSFAPGEARQRQDGQNIDAGNLRLSSFGGFAANTLSTLSTGGALADLASAVASQELGQQATLQQLRYLQHLQSQHGERAERALSAPPEDTTSGPLPAAAAAAVSAQRAHSGPPVGRQRPHSPASAQSPFSDGTTRSDGEAAGSSPVVRPTAVRPVLLHATRPPSAGSFLGAWAASSQALPEHGGGAPSAGRPAAAAAPTMRASASAPSSLTASPQHQSSARISPQRLSPANMSPRASGGADGGGGVNAHAAAGTANPTGRIATSSGAALYARSSSLSSAEVCTAMAAQNEASAPSGLGAGLSLGRGSSPRRSRSPAAAMPPNRAASTDLRMPVAASRPTTPPSLAAMSTATAPAGSATTSVMTWSGREFSSAMDIGSMPGSLEALAAQWQLDFAAQQQASQQRQQQAAMQQQQLPAAQLQRQQQQQQQEQEVVFWQRQQQQQAAALHQQRDALAYLSTAQQLQHSGAGGAPPGMWSGAYPGAHQQLLQQQFPQQQQHQAQLQTQQQGFGSAVLAPTAVRAPDQMLRQLAAAQQGGWGAVGGGGCVGNNNPSSLLPSTVPFGADPHIASGLQWYDMQRLQRQQEAEQQQQEQFARLLLAQQQQSAAQQQLLSGMRDGQFNQALLQGAASSMGFGGGSGGDLAQLAGSAPQLSASMQAWMQQSGAPPADAAAARVAAMASAGRKRSSSGELDQPAKRSSGDSGSRGQVCAQCGETNTPTWRRAGGQLLCNACGLRRYRAMARSDKKRHTGTSPPADG